MTDRLHEVGRAFPGTCEWLLEHETYRKWTACDRSLLWIRGKPGSGKSTLLKYALNNHRAGETDLILSFFFHGRGDKLEKTPLGLFQSLLHQVLRQAPDTLQDLVARFEKKREEIGQPGKDWQWHEEELLLFFESSLPKVLKTCAVWLFVDALDECGKENAVRLVEIFKSLLKNLSSQPPALRQFRICFSCRHYPILDVDKSVFEIRTENENQKDISTFLNRQLASFRRQTGSEIPDLIGERAQGVFQWARLVVKQVLDLEREGFGLKNIKAAVDSIPTDLDDLYQKLIQSMKAASIKLVQWICFATRPLTIGELPWAMIIDADCPHRSLRASQTDEDYLPDCDRMKRQVLTLSCGLAEVSGAGVVQFIHQSVKDFFMEKGLSALCGCETPTEAAIKAHFRFSKICIRYLKMEEISRSNDYKDDDFPFLRYATTSWVAHIQQCDTGDTILEDFLALFDWPSNAFIESWVRVCQVLLDPWSCPPRGTTLVHVASESGVLGLLNAILKKTNQISLDIDTRDGMGQTPLMLAAANGHEEVAKLLLGTGKVDIDAKNNEGYTPLYWAVRKRNEAIVKLLLGTGKVDINTKDNDGWTPLMWAASYENETVVKLLLGTGKADINAKDKRGRTLLMRVVIDGDETVLKLLLGTGKADINAKDKRGKTPLMQAVIDGDETVVKLLLGTGKVDINAKDNDGWTPLMWAASYENETVVKLLLDTGKVDINPKNSLGPTPLNWADRKRHEAIVKLLLDTGKVDIDVKDNDG